MRNRRYTNEQLKEAVKGSFNYAQTLSKLNIRPAGGNYQTIKEDIKRGEIDISHFNYTVLFQGKRGRKALIPLDQVLVENRHCNTVNLKNRLIAEGIFKNECNICKLTDWLGKPLALELDHISGVKSDNRIQNLRILCPNCHSQTLTHRGRNIKKFPKRKMVCLNPEEQKKCLECGLDIYPSKKFCSQRCSNKHRGRNTYEIGAGRKVERPPIEVLKNEIAELGYLQTGKKYGVTDNAIRKWVKTYEKHLKSNPSKL